MADRPGEKEDHRENIALSKGKEPVVPATDCNNTSRNTPMSNSDRTAIFPAPSVRNQPQFIAVCPECNKEKECSMIVMNHIVLCRGCNEFYLATEPKFPRRMDDSNTMNVPDGDRFQYEHALNNPQYFGKLVESIWKEKNRPFVVTMFKGKELNMHRIFAEVTSRGGINMVTREGRLPEVCAAIDENLRDGDLYHIYMEQLYHVEAFLCNFLTDRRSSSSAGQHLMQGLVGQNPSSLSETARLVPSLASAPYTSSAPVNNNQQLMSQWTQPSALCTISEPVNVDQWLMSQSIQPYAIPEPVNVHQQLTIQPIRASVPCTSPAPVNINQQLTSEPIRASARNTNAAPVNINQHSTSGNSNQQLPGSSSGPQPMQMVTGESPPYLTDNPQDIPSAGIHGRITTGSGMFHRHPCQHPSARQSNSETDSSSPSARRKQS